MYALNASSSYTELRFGGADDCARRFFSILKSTKASEGILIDVPLTTLLVGFHHVLKLCSMGKR